MIDNHQDAVCDSDGGPFGASSFGNAAVLLCQSTLGMVHGGIAATLLDTAMGLAVVSMLPAATGFTTLELKVNYVRPITDKTGVMYCEGKIIHMGSRIATAEGRLTETSGKLYGHGTTTCLVSRHESLLKRDDDHPVEGQINKLKYIKRSMYGRGNFELLRQRVLQAA